MKSDIVEYITFLDGSTAPVRQFDLSRPQSKHVRADELPASVEKEYLKFAMCRACFVLEDGEKGHYLQDIKQFISHCEMKK